MDKKLKTHIKNLKEQNNRLQNAFYKMIHADDKFGAKSFRFRKAETEYEEELQQMGRVGEEFVDAIETSEMRKRGMSKRQIRRRKR